MAAGNFLIAVPTRVLAAFLVFVAHAAALQTDSDTSGQVPRVTVAEISAAPGANLMVALSFTPDPATPLRSVTVDIEHVSNNLKFEGAYEGPAAEAADVEIVTSVTEGEPDETGVTRSTLRVGASVGKAGKEKGLPQGLLAYLTFQLSLRAQPFAIRLNTSVVSAEDLQGARVQEVYTQSGMVLVELLDYPPEAVCFFFSH